MTHHHLCTVEIYSERDGVTVMLRTSATAADAFRAYYPRQKGKVADWGPRLALGALNAGLAVGTEFRNLCAREGVGLVDILGTRRGLTQRCQAFKDGRGAGIRMRDAGNRWEIGSLWTEYRGKHTISVWEVTPGAGVHDAACPAEVSGGEHACDCDYSRGRVDA